MAVSALISFGLFAYLIYALVSLAANTEKGSSWVELGIMIFASLLVLAIGIIMAGTLVNQFFRSV